MMLAEPQEEYTVSSCQNLPKVYGLGNIEKVHGKQSKQRYLIGN